MGLDDVGPLREERDRLRDELDKTQIILAYVLYTVGGEVVVPGGESLPEGTSIEVVQAESGDVGVRLIRDK